MSPVFYQILHVGGLILLFGLMFSAYANPAPARKRALLMSTGILFVIVLVAGFGLVSKLYDNHFTGWMIAKMVIWLVIAAISGMVFRRPQKARIFAWLTAILGLVAVALVYTKPALFGF